MKSKKVKKPKPVSFHDVSTIAMVAGKEKTISKIIHDGAIKEWVGIGWITIRHARPSDYLRIPEVKG
jgi:hypothetical protein